MYPAVSIFRVNESYEGFSSIQEVNLTVLIKTVGVWNMVLSSAKGITIKNKMR